MNFTKKSASGELDDSPDALARRELNEVFIALEGLCVIVLLKCAHGGRYISQQTVVSCIALNRVALRRISTGRICGHDAVGGETDA